MPCERCWSLGLGAAFPRGVCPTDTERAGEGGKGLRKDSCDEDGGALGTDFSGGGSRFPCPPPAAAPRQTPGVSNGENSFL